MIDQVVTKRYSPPRGEKAFDFQKQQKSAIGPDPKEPVACNVYNDLKFPPKVYESITEYHEEKAEAQG